MGRTFAFQVTPASADEDQTKITEREIVISGTPEAQWKSQYYIYDRIRQEGYAGEDDEVRLRAEIHVPTTLIGRLVGKGGQNVRQLQQSTGAMIKLPEDSQQTSAREIPVKIFGSFQASQVTRWSGLVTCLPRALFSLLNDVFNRLFKWAAMHYPTETEIAPNHPILSFRRVSTTRRRRSIATMPS